MWCLRQRCSTLIDYPLCIGNERHSGDLTQKFGRLTLVCRE